MSKRTSRSRPKKGTLKDCKIVRGSSNIIKKKKYKFLAVNVKSMVIAYCMFMRIFCNHNQHMQRIFSIYPMIKVEWLAAGVLLNQRRSMVVKGAGEEFAHSSRPIGKHGPQVLTTMKQDKLFKYQMHADSQAAWGSHLMQES